MGRRSDVFVGVASIPSRESSLKKVIKRLLPQAERIGVYLNGYDRVPQYLRRQRIAVARSQDHGDLRDNGKFFFVDRSDCRYYAAVDDDLVYPRDYLRHLVDRLADADQPAAMGVHGAYYPSPVVDLFDPRVLLHFEDPSPYVMPVHLLGTGTTLIDQTEWKLEFSEFGEPGMADVWFAAAAAARDAGLFVAPRVRNWVSAVGGDMRGNAGGALFFEGLLDGSRQVSVLRRATPYTKGFEGLVTSLLASDLFLDEFSLHQALHLALIANELGYAPMSEKAASDAGAALHARGRRWSTEHHLTDSEATSVGRLAVEILTDCVTASNVEPVVEALVRLEALAATDPNRWRALPAALRYDSSPDRAEELVTTILEKGMSRGDADATQLWHAFEGRASISLSSALAVERASTRTGVERLPAFIELARENPTSAASRLYDLYEATGWKHAPDLAALRAAFGPEYESLEVQMLVSVASARSGNEEYAQRTLDRLRRRWPWDRDVQLLEASLSGLGATTPIDAILPALHVLDRALEPQGISLYRDLARSEGSGGHWIHHMGAGEKVPRGDAGVSPTVSVLMTTYNDSGTIEAAMRSILASSGVDLELILVDDASTDDTLDRVEALDDSRVVVVCNDSNVGPYLSRNRALERATGRYVAIADADDWSHPQRLHYQSSILDGSSHLVACKVAHIRVQPNGTPDLENHLRFVGDGPVTLMFRRWLVDHIGGFDHVRTRGDIEFLRRIAARFGDGALASFDTPLVLATSSVDSNSKKFKAESLNIYRAASRRWHEQRALTDALWVPLAGERAPFMAPYDLLAETERRSG